MPHLTKALLWNTLAEKMQSRLGIRKLSTAATSSTASSPEAVRVPVGDVTRRDDTPCLTTIFAEKKHGPTCCGLLCSAFADQIKVVCSNATLLIILLAVYYKLFGLWARIYLTNGQEWIRTLNEYVIILPVVHILFGAWFSVASTTAIIWDNVAQRWIYHKFLEHGVLIDFKNRDMDGCCGCTCFAIPIISAHFCSAIVWPLSVAALIVGSLIWELRTRAVECDGESRPKSFAMVQCEFEKVQGFVIINYLIDCGFLAILLYTTSKKARAIEVHGLLSLNRFVEATGGDDDLEKSAKVLGESIIRVPEAQMLSYLNSCRNKMLSMTNGDNHMIGIQSFAAIKSALPPKVESPKCTCERFKAFYQQRMCSKWIKFMHSRYFEDKEWQRFVRRYSGCYACSFYCSMLPLCVTFIVLFSFGPRFLSTLGSGIICAEDEYLFDGINDFNEMWWVSNDLPYFNISASPCTVANNSDFS